MDKYYYDVNEDTHRSAKIQKECKKGKREKLCTVKRVKDVISSTNMHSKISGKTKLRSKKAHNVIFENYEKISRCLSALQKQHSRNKSRMESKTKMKNKAKNKCATFIYAINFINVIKIFLEHFLLVYFFSLYFCLFIFCTFFALEKL